MDADFVGVWNKAESGNSEALLSRAGHILIYDTCLVIWYSKLQTEIAVSTMEAKYIAVNQAARKVLLCTNLLKEINEVFTSNLKEAKLYCEAFENNNSCISLATDQKLSSRTKHIPLKYHHFRQFVKDKTTRIFPIDKKEQTADIFTIPLDEVLFLYLRNKLSG